MTMRKRHWLSSALILSTTALSLTAPNALALEGKEIVKPEMDDLDLFMPNNNVIVTLENGSHSGKLNDFQLSIQNQTLTLSGMTGVLHCGKHTSARNPTHPDSGTAANNGSPKIHFGVVGSSGLPGSGPIYTVKDPNIKITTYERGNQNNTTGYVKRVQGNPWDFHIPVNKLVEAGNGGSLDIKAEFEKKMNAYINGGGNKIDFLRQDQFFDMTGHVTLEAACFSVYPRKGYHVKPFQVAIKYIGDKSLKYGSTIPGPSDPKVALPLHTSNVSLTIDPAKQEDNCPYEIEAVANLTFNQIPASPKQYRVRFLEDGKPATPWMVKVLDGTNQAEFKHKISIGSLTPNQSISLKGGEANKPAPASPTKIGMKKKPEVTVEVKTDNNAITSADATYEASCKPKNTATFVPGTKDQPDLTSRVGITIGQQSTSWGGKITLKDSDITDVTPRGCRVRYRYDVVNIGTGDASGFQNRLTVAGKQGDNATLPKLDANDSKYAAGTVLIPAGISQIGAAIDSLKQIDEIKENNNLFSVTVEAPEKCGGGIPSRPSSPTHPRPSDPTGKGSVPAPRS